MNLQDILDWLQTMDLTKKNNNQEFPVLEEDGWLRLFGNGGQTMLNRSDSDMSLRDMMYLKHPGLIKQWNNEANVNRDPLPSPDIGREAYQIMKERKRYKGLL